MNKYRKLTVLSILLLISSLAFTFLFTTPIKGLGKTYYLIFIHPPFAWTAYIFFVTSAFWGYKYIRSGNEKYALQSYAINCVGYLFILFAAFSGMAWGKMIWGGIGIENLDPKFTSIVFALILYSAYFIMRKSVDEYDKQLRLSSIYALFTTPFMTFFIFVMPRLRFSLHPKNPLFSFEKSIKDGEAVKNYAFGFNNLFAVLLGLTAVLIFAWLIYKLRYRLELNRMKLEDINE